MTHRPPCCNNDCDQGDTCPNRTRADGSWWAEVIVAVSYVLVALILVAVVIVGSSHLAAYMLTLSPTPHTNTCK